MKNEDRLAPDATVEMPVQMALMMAENESAVDAFASLTSERRDEYVRRARAATGHDQLRSVVEDIAKIR